MQPSIATTFTQAARRQRAMHDNLARTVRLPVTFRPPAGPLPCHSFVAPRPKHFVAGRPSDFRPPAPDGASWPRTAFWSLAGALASAAGTLLVLGLLSSATAPRDRTQTDKGPALVALAERSLVHR